MDTSVRPQDDLFDAMNGRWLKTTPIPADKSRWGVSVRSRSAASPRR
jgi:putative endopeptidase